MKAAPVVAAEALSREEGDAICAAVLELVVRVRAKRLAQQAEADDVQRLVWALIYRIRDERGSAA